VTEPLEAREQGLQRALSVRLLGMIAIGQSIGVGLFLGSGLSVKMAGPAVIVSYLIGAAITYPVMRALAEMTAAHPMAGSFGAYAEHYVSPLAGWVTRYTYCMAQVVAIGSQVLAVAIYCRYWFPAVPPGVWIAVFSMSLLAINCLDVGRFGELEFWFSLVKVVAIVLFMIFGAALFAGVGVPRQGLENFTAHGGFLARGWAGVWAAVTMAMFSYYGLEAAALGSGEAKDPRETVPRALRTALLRLVLFYTVSIAILVGIVPWTEVDIAESPFVRVYRLVGIPRAAGLMNFVVLSAALSSLNSNLYATARMLFSLARSGQAPAGLGALTPKGVPRHAVLAAGLGFAAADALARVFPETAFVYMLGAALFGGMFCWGMVFVTHLRFRGGRRAPLSIAGLAAIAAVLVTMAFLPEMRASWIAGIPWLAAISLAFFVHSARQNRRNSGTDTSIPKFGDASKP
jgi:AAT family amino acid transporter